MKKDFHLAEYHNHDFSESRFERADFLGAIFTGCNFSASDFTRAYITGARFENCDFTFAKFHGTYIFSSQFKNCNFLCSSMEDVLLATVDFVDSPFTNVDWHGTAINSPPLMVQGIEYPITVLDNGYMHVGCEFNTIDFFWNADERLAASGEGLRAARFWRKNKQWIFQMLKDRGYYEHGNTYSNLGSSSTL
jgi:uncharacterized protein YjbI with pentapeptide repeats